MNAKQESRLLQNFSQTSFSDVIIEQMFSCLTLLIAVFCLRSYAFFSAVNARNSRDLVEALISPRFNYSWMLRGGPASHDIQSDVTVQSFGYGG